MGNVTDKHAILDRLSTSSPVILELGCGDRKKNSAAIGIDMLDYSDVDLVGDIFDVLKMFPNSSVTHVSSHHFIEHVSDIDLLMSELARVVKADGIVDFTVPHFSNPYFYSDPTHRIFFGLYTFCYLSRSTLFSRTTPTYQKEFEFSLERVELNFKSTKPFYVRHIIKLVFGLFFNSCRYLKELYEENFCYLIPCYEIQYRLRRLGSSDL